LIPENRICTAQVITREDCVLCGSEWFDETFHQLGGIEKIHWQVQEGDFIHKDTNLVTLTGNARSLLTGERTALNFLQFLSAVATKSRSYAQLAKDTSIRVFDTRKTVPGLRNAQKYAVRIGGCENHRIGLYDAFLIKENHIMACGSITKAIEAARRLRPLKPVIVEVESINELKQALESKADRIMLDNFSENQLQQVRNLDKAECLLELSGSINRDTLSQFVDLDVDIVSIGDLTKNIESIDLSMRFSKEPSA